MRPTVLRSATLATVIPVVLLCTFSCARHPTPSSPVDMELDVQLASFPAATECESIVPKTTAMPDERVGAVASLDDASFVWFRDGSSAKVDRDGKVKWLNPPFAVYSDRTHFNRAVYAAAGQPYVIFAEWQAEVRLYIVRADTGTLVRTLLPACEWVMSIAFDPTSADHVLATVDATRLVKWAIDGRPDWESQLATFKPNDGSAMVWPDSESNTFVVTSANSPRFLPDASQDRIRHVQVDCPPVAGPQRGGSRTVLALCPASPRYFMDLADPALLRVYDCSQGKWVSQLRFLDTRALPNAPSVASVLQVDSRAFALSSRGDVHIIGFGDGRGLGSFVLSGRDLIAVRPSAVGDGYEAVIWDWVNRSFVVSRTGGE